MFQRLARIFVVLAAVQMLGGHWMALQSAAWMHMLFSYSRGASVLSAVEQTFDGKHPCSLCKVVKQGRETEKKDQSVTTVVKFEAVLTDSLRIAECESGEWEFAPLISRSPVRGNAPPTPPPLVG